ncbi:MAG: hypothetical protein A2X12_07100 [Bacteroidetes bacterium GWE2_29_8]|nr:MAG: hypothetical protein A2X12_07100 [Bacteroidetes bacterium GWE2_29_8]
MSKNISKKDIYNFLKNNTAKTSILNKLKIVYRPFICPFDELLNEIEINSSLFDIGCGSGQFLSIVAKFKSSKALGGVEIDSELVNNALKLLEQYAPISKIEQYDGVNLPTYIENYKYITLIDVIHHVNKEKQNDFIAEIYNKMSLGSRLILKDINADSFFVWGNKIHDLILSKEIGKELSLKAMIDILKAQGFKIVKISQKRLYWYPHYTIVCDKI